MKKIFTLIAALAVTAAMQAAITIYVQATYAPYLWAWVGSTNLMTEDWPGHQLTDKKTVQGTEFWYYTFAEDVTTVNILFNNGAGKQTGDINGITTDRYFTYDGEAAFTDVTEQYGGVVPDAEVTSLSVKGNQDNWADDVLFTVVEAGKSFRLVIDLSSNTVPENLWKFKIRPNAQDWVGYSQVTLTGTAVVGQAAADDNFEIDLETEGKQFTLTATWAGGKDASAGWTLNVDKGNAAGINAITSNGKLANGAIYNLAGQRVSNNYRGIVIKDGKKVMQ